MGNLISTKKKQKIDDRGITEVDKAVLSLRTQRRKLNAERRRLEDIVQKNADAVKELLKNKEKSRALLALKKKKMREEQLQGLENWLLNVEQLLSNIELAKQQNAIFAALRSGTDALQQVQKEVKLEDIDKLTEDTNEAKAYMDEIKDALAADSSEDIEELEAELQALETTVLDEEMEKFPTAPKVTPSPSEYKRSNHVSKIPVELPTVPKETKKELEEQNARTEEPLLA